MGMKEEMVQDRCAWRNITEGSTRASGQEWKMLMMMKLNIAFFGIL